MEEAMFSAPALRYKIGFGSLGSLQMVVFKAIWHIFLWLWLLLHRVRERISGSSYTPIQGCAWHPVRGRVWHAFL